MSLQRKHNYKRDNEGLSDQMREFCHNYCTHFDRAKAYVEAGYKADNPTRAREASNRLMQQEKVARYIDEILAAKRQDTIDLDVNDLIRELNAIAMTRINQLVDLDSGDLLSKQELTKGDALAAVAEFSCDEFETEAVSKKKRKVKLADKRQAIETLLRIKGYTSELPQALRVLEAYGIKLRQNESGEWAIEQ